MERKNKIGKLGEKELDKWATQMDCTINKSIEDEEGWDFIIEFPPNFSTNSKQMPLDKVDSPLKCWIQVKSTDDKKGTRLVNLKNWLRLVKTPYPSFFLVFEFDGKDEPQKGFLIHIGEDYIRQALKRLRELGSKNQNNLHNKRMQFIYDVANEIFPMNGEGLRSSVKKHVSSTNEYMNWKQRFLEEVGYENGKYRIQVQMVLSDDQEVDPLEKLVDLSLGIIPKAETNYIEINEIRFGIEAPELTQVFDQPSFFSIFDNKPVEKSKIIFRLEDFSREATILADLYVPKGFKFDLDRQYWKARFTAPFFELIFIPETGEGKIDFSWPEIHEKHRLLDLYRISQLLLLLFEAESKKLAVRTEIVINNQTINGNHAINVHISQEVAETAIKVESAWWIAKYFDIQNEIELSIDDVLEQKLILAIRLLLENKIPDFQATYWVDKESSYGSALTYFPKLLFLPLGRYGILSAFVITGYPEKTGDEKDGLIEWRVISNEISTSRSVYVHNIDTEDIFLRARVLLNSVVDPIDDSEQMILFDDEKRFLDE